MAAVGAACCDKCLFSGQKLPLAVGGFMAPLPPKTWDLWRMVSGDDEELSSLLGASSVLI